MTIDGTLASIDAALESWEHGPDAARHSDAFPCLGTMHRAAVARLCARTGMDGYAATLIIADTAEWGTLSPWHATVAEVAPPFPGGLIDPARLAEAMRPFTITMQQFAAGMAEIGTVLARALTPLIALAAEMDRPVKPVPLCIDGREYTRRQRARKRRRRG